LGKLSGSPEAPIPFAMAEIARLTGDNTRLDAAEAVLEKMGAVWPLFFSWRENSRQAALALTAFLRKDKAAAQACLAYLRPRKGYYLPPSAIGKSSDRLLGLLFTVLGRLSEAAASFQDALAFCRRAGYRPELAWTCYDYAEALMRRDARGDRERAKSLLNEASALTRELGMRPLLARLEQRLRRVSRSPSVGTARPAGLTEREVDVLRLVARGFTNREIGGELFISTSTVAKHIRNVLGKTGMANRAEAAVLLVREGLLDA
jgi:ATP/maltotriose-dependent transcriptional regulator MalT